MIQYAKNAEYHTQRAREESSGCERLDQNNEHTKTIVSVHRIYIFSNTLR
jgi:hypothetical protein